MAVRFHLILPLFIVLAFAACRGNRDENTNPLTNFTPSSVPPTPPIYNATGVWPASLSTVFFDPGSSGLPITGNVFSSTGTLLIAQNGSTVDVNIDMPDFTRHGWTGAVNGDTYTVSERFPISYITETLIFTLTSSNTLTGTLDWNIVYGTVTASGQYAITAYH